MSGKIRNQDEIIALFKDGQTIVVGGFANHGVPDALVSCVLESGARHLTLISNDTGDANLTVGRLIHNGRVGRMIGSHIGMNSEMVEMVAQGKIEVTLSPQGSFAERLRCGGAGLGGVLTKTGLGTIAENGKQVLEMNSERWILETPLRGDVALVRAHGADPLGNLTYRGTSRNFNPLAARAADLTVVEADCFLELGELEPDRIITPGVYVDMILAH
ncbi:CoA transferase subunit A [Rhodopseudomonas palustris]|uniref:3-oxoacid CoA-transferase, subunit A n=1 Tax=Rhodopseudomonas palustris (strain BisB18) TaxID=316056 RepID=Q21BM6_RHOPB